VAYGAWLRAISRSPLAGIPDNIYDPERAEHYFATPKTGMEKNGKWVQFEEPTVLLQVSPAFEYGVPSKTLYLTREDFE